MRVSLNTVLFANAYSAERLLLLLLLQQWLAITIDQLTILLVQYRKNTQM